MGMSKDEFTRRMMGVEPEQVAAKLERLFEQLGAMSRRIAELEARVSALSKRAG